MGRLIFNMATLSNGFNTEYKIKGFLDDDKDALRGFEGYPPIIDTIKHYIPEADDVFVCSMGDVVQKKRSIQLILDKGGEFINLIHPDAFIGAESTVSDYVLIQTFAVIGHDVKIGKYSRVDSHVVCVGGVELKDEVTIHSCAVINIRVIVEKGATVGALSFVIRRVKENTTVFGNPAKTLKWKLS